MGLSNKHLAVNIELECSVEILKIFSKKENLSYMKIEVLPKRIHGAKMYFCFRVVFYFYPYMLQGKTVMSSL